MCRNACTTTYPGLRVRRRRLPISSVARPSAGLSASGNPPRCLLVRVLCASLRSHGIVKTYCFFYENCEIYHVVFAHEAAPNRIVACARRVLRPEERRGGSVRGTVRRASGEGIGRRLAWGERERTMQLTAGAASDAARSSRGSHALPACRPTLPCCAPRTPHPRRLPTLWPCRPPTPPAHGPHAHAPPALSTGRPALR